MTEGHEDELVGQFDAISIQVDPREKPVAQMADVVRTCMKLFDREKEKCVWISFYGYDDDPREVWDMDPRTGRRWRGMRGTA